MVPNPDMMSAGNNKCVIMFKLSTTFVDLLKFSRVKSSLRTILSAIQYCIHYFLPYLIYYIPIIVRRKSPVPTFCQKLAKCKSDSGKWRESNWITFYFIFIILWDSQKDGICFCLCSKTAALYSIYSVNLFEIKYNDLGCMFFICSIHLC